MKKTLVFFSYNRYNSLVLKTNNEVFGLQLYDVEVLVVN